MAWVYHNKPPMGWPLDLSEPINDGLVGYWYMPEGSGNKVFDLSENGYGMGFVASPIWTSGKHGSAILFNGSTQYLSRNFAFVNAVPLTVVAWAYTNATGSNQSIFSITDTNTLFDHFRLQRRALNDKIIALTNDSGGSSFSEYPVAPAINTWFQAAAVFAAANSRIVYVDGIAATEETTSRTPNTGNVDITTIGSSFYDSIIKLPWSGKIGMVMLYNRALPASEIALLHRFPFYGFLNPDEIPVLDQYYTVGVGNAGIMTTNTGYWGPTF